MDLKEQFSGVTDQTKKQIAIAETLARSVVEDGSKISAGLYDLDISKLNFTECVSKYIIKIPKNKTGTNYELIFDIKNGVNIIWDLLFLREILYKYLKEYVKQNQGTAEEIFAQQIFSEIEDKSNSTGNFPNVSVTLTGLDDSTSLSNNLTERIKESVVIAQKLKDIFSHGTSKVASNPTDQTITIRNEYNKNRMMFETNLSYIQDFGSGIIPRSEDLPISNKVKKQFKKITSRLNISVEKAPTFLYRISPTNLKKVMSVAGNNYEKFSFLPLTAFSDECTLEHLELLYEKSGNDFRNLEGMRPRIFNCKLEVLEFWFGKKGEPLKYPLEQLKKLSTSCYCVSPLKIEYIIKKHLNNNIEHLTILPPNFIFASNETLDAIYNRTKNKEHFIDILKRLPKEIFGLEIHTLERLFTNTQKETIEELLATIHPKLSLRLYYTYPMDRILFVLSLVDNNYEQVELVPSIVYSKEIKEERIKEVLSIVNGKIKALGYIPRQLLYEGADLTNFKKICEQLEDNYNYLGTIPTEVFLSKKPIIVQKKDSSLSIISQEKFNGTKITQEQQENLPLEAHRTDCTKEKLIQIRKIVNRIAGINENEKCSDLITELPSYVFRYYCNPDRITELLDFIKNNQNRFKEEIPLNTPTDKINALKQFSRICFYSTSTMYKIEFIIFDILKGDLSLIKYIPSYLFTNKINTKRILEVFQIIKNPKIFKLLDKNLYTMPDENFNTIIELITINVGSEQNGVDKIYDIKELISIPKEVFKCSNPNSIRAVYNYGESTENRTLYIKTLFNNPDERLIAIRIYLKELLYCFKDLNEQMKEKNRLFNKQEKTADEEKEYEKYRQIFFMLRKILTSLKDNDVKISFSGQYNIDLESIIGDINAIESYYNEILSKQADNNIPEENKNKIYEQNSLAIKMLCQSLEKKVDNFCYVIERAIRNSESHKNINIIVDSDGNEYVELIDNFGNSTTSFNCRIPLKNFFEFFEIIKNILYTTGEEIEKIELASLTDEEVKSIIYIDGLTTKKYLKLFNDQCSTLSTLVKQDSLPPPGAPRLGGR